MGHEVDENNTRERLHCEVEASILLFVSLQSHVLGFIKDLFNFDIADYSSVESLCDSIVRLARERVGLLLGKHDHDHAEITDPFSQVKSLNVQNECVEVGKSEAT